LKIGSNKVFGYYLEISRAGNISVPPEYQRKQTLVSAERYITEELKQFEETLLASESLGEQRERALYAELCSSSMARARELQGLGRSVAEVDVLRSLGEVGWERKYVRPLLSSDDVLEVLQGRHPVVEASLETRPFVPNDLRLSQEGRRIAIVTGPNMAGKSTYLRMGALLILMAHMGSFVPAESARIPLMDRIFTRIGARDELDRGNSTFMVEMLETANILHNLTSRSFVVLDEIGRGTSTYDGMSIAWAILEYLARSEHQARVLFATHYHELTRLGEEYPEIANLSMAVEENEAGITFLHRVVPYPADRSYGIEVARLAGIPEAVLHRSQELLERFEQERSPEGLPGELPPRREEPVQKKLFPHAEGQAILDELALLDPDGMTPLKALETLYMLKKRSLQVVKELT
jgi:DNA mismatch repair protein MutS